MLPIYEGKEKPSLAMKSPENWSMQCTAIISRLSWVMFDQALLTRSLSQSAVFVTRDLVVYQGRIVIRGHLL